MGEGAAGEGVFKHQKLAGDTFAPCGSMLCKKKEALCGFHHLTFDLNFFKFYFNVLNPLS